MNRFFLTLAAMLWAHVWCAAAPAPDGVRGTVRLVATYVGFVVDTLAVAPWRPRRISRSDPWPWPR